MDASLMSSLVSRATVSSSNKTGKPQQNAYIERYNRTVRYDWLGQHLFSSLDELQGYATRWQWFYNHERPNMALNGFTPMQHIQHMT